MLNAVSRIQSELSVVNKLKLNSIVPADHNEEVEEEVVGEEKVDVDNNDGDNNDGDKLRVIARISPSGGQNTLFPHHVASDEEITGSREIADIVDQKEIDNLEDIRDIDCVNEEKIDLTIAEIKTSLENSKPMKYLRSRGFILNEDDDFFYYYKMAETMMETELRERTELYQYRQLVLFDSDSDDDSDIEPGPGDGEDSSDYDENDDNNARIRTINNNRNKCPPARNEDTDTDTATHTKDEYTAALTYLESKGISLIDDEKSSKWVEIAQKMRTVENNVKEMARLKTLLENGDSDSSEYSEGDSDGSSEEDFDEAEALVAYRYLDANGITLDEDADVVECMELAKVMMREDTNTK